MNNIQKLTHELAVNAYLIRHGFFLLLKRNKPPLIWGPPGGRLKRQEDPIDGLVREVYEETGQFVNVLEPVTTWFGNFNGRRLLSLDYLCTTSCSDVKLSSEHSDYRWLTLKELKATGKYHIDETGFRYEDYEKAWRRYNML